MSEIDKTVADEVAAAEAELRAAQEKLEAAKAKLEQESGAEEASAEASAEAGTEASAEAVVAEADAEAVVEEVKESPATQETEAIIEEVQYGSVADEAKAEPEVQATYEPPEWTPYSTAPYEAPQAAGDQGAASQANPQQAAGQPAAGYAVPPTPNAGQAPVPPQQPYYGYQQPYYQQPNQAAPTAKDHVAAGLLAIFLGAFGIHKFYLGYTTQGFIMLAVTLIGGLFTFSFAAWVMCIIGIIEGILYLTKSQPEFESTYVFNKREWF